MRKFAGLVLALAVVAGACSSGSSGSDAGKSGGAGAKTSTTTAADLDAATLRVGSSAIGKVLTDADGMTLYEYVPDGKNATSQVPEGALAAWPPLVAEGPVTLGTGLTAEGGAAEQPNGEEWVTYNGRLVYRYTGDTRPGDVNGNGIGSVWYALTPAGEPVQS